MDNKVTEYIIKHSKKRDQELKYDFMPAMLEIIEKPAHKAGKVIIWSIFSMLIVAVVWAALAKLDIMVNANATVSPEGNVNVLKAYNAGVVKSINVVEGQYVKEGDVLIEFDEQATEINEEQLLLQEKMLEAQKGVCQMLLDGKYESVDTEAYSDSVKPTVVMLLEWYRSYVNKSDILQKEIDAQTVNKQIAEIQLKNYKPLGNSGQIETAQLQVKQYDIAIEQAKLNLEANEIELATQLNSKLTTITSELSQVEGQLSQYSLSKKYQTIVASTDGYVGAVGVARVGENVSVGQEMITIVPKDAVLEIVTYVPDNDIADITVGMEAELKLESYSYNDYGTVKAKVKYISPVAVVDETMGNVYLVRLEVVEVPEKVSLITGMQGTLELRVGKRTVLDYLLDPIKKGMGNSLKEK